MKPQSSSTARRSTILGLSSEQPVAARLRTLLNYIAERFSTWRLPILLVAVAIFLGGSIISFRSLDIVWDDIHIAPLIFLATVLVPLNILYSAVNMMLMGKASRLRITLIDGIRISAFAQVAEMLPIPGGAIVRTAALMKAGGNGWRSTGLVLSFSILWVACAAIGGGIALADKGPIALLLLAMGSSLALGSIGWLGWKFDWRTAVLATGLRIVGIALVGWRMVAAFAVIGVAVSWLESLTFAFTVILGSAASVVPAGLGIGESLSALIAGAIGLSAAAAFLATAINRAIGLGVHISIASAFLFLENRKVERRADG